MDIHSKGVKITPQGRFLVNCLCGWHSPAVLLIESRLRAEAIFTDHVEDVGLAAQYKRNQETATDVTVNEHDTTVTRYHSH